MQDERTIREDERLRIARDIHDELGAVLTTLKWDLESLDESLSRVADLEDLAAVHVRVEELISVVDNTFEAVRIVTSALRSKRMEGTDLAQALQRQVDEFQRQSGIACESDVNVAAGTELDLSQWTAIIRVVQESLTNVRRHSGATKVRILINEIDCQLVLRVGDDGRGFAAAGELRFGTFGLKGMEERARNLGGDLQVITGTGQGTEIILRIPTRSERR